MTERSGSDRYGPASDRGEPIPPGSGPPELVADELQDRPAWTHGMRPNTMVKVGMEWAQAGVLAGLVGLVYAPTLLGMYRKWAGDDDYSHAFLIPLLVGYLLWEDRHRLKHARKRPCWPGLFLLIIATLLSYYGILGSDISAARISWWLMVVAIILFCYGLETFKVLLLPLLILSFTIPLPNVINAKVMVYLKMVSSSLGAFILRLFGYPVFVQGNIIDLGITQLQVVDACSGLRYVLPLLAIGLVSAHFFQKVLWKKALLVLATIPVAILMNTFRIAGTGIITNTLGQEYAEGFFHGFSGWLVFMSSFGLLFALNLVLNRFGGRRTAPEATKARSPEARCQMSTDGPPTPPLSIANHFPALICLACLSSILALGLRTTAMPALKLPQGITSFPLEFSGWQGTREYLNPEITALSGAEEAFAAAYRKGPAMVSFYLGYRGSPFLESEEFFHSPNICLPSQGWQTIEETTMAIPEVHPSFKRFVVRRMVLAQHGGYLLTFYWFQTRNTVAHDIFRNRLHLALHALKRDNTSDTFVRLLTMVPREKSLDEAEAWLIAFVHDLEPVLLQFLGH